MSAQFFCTNTQCLIAHICYITATKSHIQEIQPLATREGLSIWKFQVVLAGPTDCFSSLVCFAAIIVQKQAALANPLGKGFLGVGPKQDRENFECESLAAPFHVIVLPDRQDQLPNRSSRIQLSFTGSRKTS
jgi:hypothetical protein